MKRFMVPFAVAIAALSSPAAAQGVHVGAQVGVNTTEEPNFGDEVGTFYGAYAGADLFDLALLKVGVEVNFNASDGTLTDTEYGALAYGAIAFPSGTRIMGRAGYQFVDVDTTQIVCIDFPCTIDDQAGGFLLGAGVEFPLAGPLYLRGTVDTIEFNGVRAAAGVTVRF